VRLNVKQISTKDDTDDFARHIVLRLSWSVTAKGVVTTDPDRNDPSTLMDRVGQTVHVQLALASGTQNSEQGDVMLAGDAIIQDVQITTERVTDDTQDQKGALVSQLDYDERYTGTMTVIGGDGSEDGTVGGIAIGDTAFEWANKKWKVTGLQYTGNYADKKRYEISFFRSALFPSQT
jgi:hypothetical protein